MINKIIKTMRVILLVLLFTNLGYGLSAQSIGIGTTSPNPSAMLDVSASNKGFLPPRMSKMERNAIVAPADGLVVFQIGVDSSGLYYFNNGGWAWLQHATKPQGKTFIFLKDGITNAQAAAQLAKEAGTSTQYVSIKNTTVLTTVDLSGLENIIELKVENNTSLSSIIATTLVGNSDGITINQNPSLTNIDLQSLSDCGFLTVSNNAVLNSINLSMLARFSSNFSNQIFANPMLASVNLSSLNNVGNFAISNIVATSLNFPMLANAGGLIISNCNMLTNVSLPLLSTVNGFTISNAPSLATISLDAILSVGPMGLTVSGCSALTNLSLQNLPTSAGTLNFSNNSGLQSFSLPILASCTDLNLSSSTSLISLSAPLLITSNQINITGAKFSSLIFPALKSASNILANNCSLLTNISFPTLTTVSGFSILGNPFCTSVSVPVLASYNSFVINSCKLNSSAVNIFLTQLLSITPAGGKSIFLNGNTPAAPPTGAGITAKATLISQGNYVTTD